MLLWWKSLSLISKILELWWTFISSCNSLIVAKLNHFLHTLDHFCNASVPRSPSLKCIRFTHGLPSIVIPVLFLLLLVPGLYNSFHPIQNRYSYGPAGTPGPPGPQSFGYLTYNGVLYQAYKCWARATYLTWRNEHVKTRQQRISCMILKIDI